MNSGPAPPSVHSHSRRRTAAAAEMNGLVYNIFDRAAWEAELAEEMAFAETWDGMENPPLDDDCDGLEA